MVTPQSVTRIASPLVVRLAFLMHHLLYKFWSCAVHTTLCFSFGGRATSILFIDVSGEDALCGSIVKGLRCINACVCVCVWSLSALLVLSMVLARPGPCNTLGQMSFYVPYSSVLGISNTKFPADIFTVRVLNSLWTYILKHKHWLTFQVEFLLSTKLLIELPT